MRDYLFSNKLSLIRVKTVYYNYCNTISCQTLPNKNNYSNFNIFVLSTLEGFCLNCNKLYIFNMCIVYILSSDRNPDRKNM